MSRILVVDDDKAIRALLVPLLQSDGYGCSQAADAYEARVRLQENQFDLILCDVRMPGESGMELISDITGRFPETAVIMVTAVDDPKIAEAALDLGAYGYILKPFKINEVFINIANALRRRNLEIQNRFHCENLEKMVEERTKALQDTLNHLRNSMTTTVQAIGRTVEMSDPYTAGHQQRVSGLASALAREMEFSEEQVEGIGLAGMIHDLGKITIPVAILTKPARLTDAEFDLIKTHAWTGYDILKKIEFPWPIAQMVYQHHERMDGSGYPQGLSEEDILEEASILGVADVVEAMSSHRPYRPALGVDKALDEITEKKGDLYDPDVVEACLTLFKEKNFKLN